MCLKRFNLVLVSEKAAKLDPVSFNVLKQIAYRAFDDDDGWCKMPLRQLQRETGFGESAFRRALRRLEGEGFIIGGGRQGSRAAEFQVLEAPLQGGESPAVQDGQKGPSGTSKTKVRQTFTSVPRTEVEQDRFLFTSVRGTGTSVRGTEVGAPIDQYKTKTKNLRSRTSARQTSRARSLANFDRQAPTWLRFLHETVEAKPEDYYDPYRALGDRYNRAGLETALRALAGRDGFTGPRIDHAIEARVRQFIQARSKRELEAAEQEARDRRLAFDRAKRNGFRDAAPSMRAQLAAAPTRPTTDPDAMQPSESFTAYRNRISGRDENGEPIAAVAR